MILVSISFVFSQASDVKNELRYIEQYTPTTVDPITVHDPTSQRITEILFGSLYSMNRFLERIPEFADGEPQLTPDKKSAIVKLKEGIKFSDGTPITPEDIIFSFQAAIDPGSDNFNRQAYANIKSISPVDASTIRIEFNSPVTDAKKYLRFFIIPKSAFLSPQISRQLTFCREPGPSSGSYSLLVRSETGNEYHFQANPNYVGKNKPQIDKIKMNVHRDLKAHADNLKNGLVDLVPFVPPDAVPQLKKDSRFKLDLYDSNQYDAIIFNFNNKLLQITAVRQAINYAFNREDMLASFFNGDGALMSGPFPPSHQGNNPDVQPWSYQPTMAKTILTNLGMVDTDGDGIREFNGKPVQFNLLSSSAGDANYNAIILSFIQQMKNIGILINNNAYMANLYESNLQLGKFDMVYYTRKVTPEGDYSPFFLSSQAFVGGKNIGYYKNSLVDSLFIQSRLTKDFQMRTKIYESLHKILHDDCPYVYLWYLRYNAAYIRELENVSIDPFYFFTTIEDWFFKSE